MSSGDSIRRANVDTNAQKTRATKPARYSDRFRTTHQPENASGKTIEIAKEFAFLAVNPY
jgi:hypothetical protein